MAYEHEDFRMNFDSFFLCQQPAVHKYLADWGRADVSTPDGCKYEPDMSFGPRRSVGATLPEGVPRFSEWRTLILEVEYSRHGTNFRNLDRKAQRLARIIGLRYILCVVVTQDCATAKFKLHLVQGHNPLLPHLEAVPVVAPQTLVQYDFRVLLGLEPGDVLPTDPSSGVQFPEMVIVDLYAVLLRCQRVTGTFKGGQ